MNNKNINRNKITELSLEPFLEIRVIKPQSLEELRCERTNDCSNWSTTQPIDDRRSTTDDQRPTTDDRTSHNPTNRPIQTTKIPELLQIQDGSTHLSSTVWWLLFCRHYHVTHLLLSLSRHLRHLLQWRHFRPSPFRALIPVVQSVSEEPCSQTASGLESVSACCCAV